MRTIPIGAVAGVVALILSGCGGGSGGESDAAAAAPATFAEVQQILERRCFACHSEKPTMEGYTAPAGALRLDETKNVELLKEVIYERVAVAKDMPLGNATAMTEAERQRVASWFEAQQ